MTAMAHADFDGTTLVVGNALIERRGRLDGTSLTATGLTDLRTGRDWAAGEPPAPSLAREVAGATGPTELRVECKPIDIVGVEALHAELVTPTEQGDLVRRFVVLDDFAAIAQQLVSVPSVAGSGPATTDEAVATGTETDAPRSEIDPSDVIDALTIDPLHCRLVAPRFVDQTDHHNEVVQQREWLLHPSEKSIAVQGNLWFLEHNPSGAGVGMLKIAPGPEHRFDRVPDDLQIIGEHLVTRGHGVSPTGYRQWTFLHDNGPTGRTTAVQRLQLQLRPVVPGRDGLAVSNTWGDRSQDSRMTEDFLLAEVAAAAELGVDVVQLDDGWQKGTTANAWNRPQDGAWGDYWAIDPQFWTPRPSGLPNGLEPVVDAAHRAGLHVGLWFSPDSSSEFANWEADRDCLTDLVTRHGITQVKSDGVLLTSARAERRYRRLIDQMLQRTDGALTFDLDVTAQVRLGYWGAPHAGPVFVENRYTDFHNYWPHQTLRTLWRLSHHLHPVRLRLEFLNPYRNTDRYAGDPLAPEHYRPATLFATVMMASPLAWFELSEAPAEFRAEIAELVRIWKQVRHRIHTEVVLPIGDEPDGWSWTGLCTAPREGDAYAVVFRPLDSGPDWSFCLPHNDLPNSDLDRVEGLHGNGRAVVDNGRVRVEIDEPLGHAFLRIH